MEIRSRLETIAAEIRRTIPRVQIQLTVGDTPKLLVGTPDARVKVEPSVVIRGSLLPPVESDLCPAAQPVTLDELEAARTLLFEWAATALTSSERRFLLSIKQAEPDWEQLPFEGLKSWPSIQWKLHNIRQMSARNHEAALRRLRDVLET